MNKCYYTYSYLVYRENRSGKTLCSDGTNIPFFTASFPRQLASTS